MSDLEYIKQFSKITISSVCKQLKIAPNNMWAGRLNDKQYSLIKKCIIANVSKLNIEDYKKDLKSK